MNCLLDNVVIDCVKYLFTRSSSKVVMPIVENSIDMTGPVIRKLAGISGTFAVMASAFGSHGLLIF